MAAAPSAAIIEAVLQLEVNELVLTAAATGTAISESTRVGAVMHRGVITCAPDSSGLAVARIMAAHRIHSVVVAIPGAPPRVVTDADVAAALYEGTLATSMAAEIAKPAAIVLREDTLQHTTECMHEHGTTHAVVVADRRAQRPVGVLSVLDIAEVIAGGREL